MIGKPRGHCENVEGPLQVYKTYAPGRYLVPARYLPWHVPGKSLASAWHMPGEYLGHVRNGRSFSERPFFSVTDVYSFVSKIGLFSVLTLPFVIFSFLPLEEMFKRASFQQL